MLNKLFSFNGGVTPAYEKTRSAEGPILPVPLPAELVIPLHQHVGGPPRPVVQAGDRVTKGQRIGKADGNASATVHASTSGLVSAVEMRRMPHSSGLSALSVIIKPDGLDAWGTAKPLDLHTASPTEIRDHLMQMGVVGLGGAVFPTHLKIVPGQPKALETLVINGAECEPFITCDDLLMRQRADTVIAGVALMCQIMKPDRTLIGIEDNKPEAIRAMQQAIEAQHDKRLEVVSVPTRYPAGGAKQLIRVLTGIEVPHGERSTDYGVQCFNVGTAVAVHDAIKLGRPLVSRIVTVSGNVRRGGNYDVLIGTPMRDVVALSEAHADTNRYIMGGPMMGVVMPGMEVPVVKATNCILVGSPKMFPPPPPEMPCIRCGECAIACPADLQPFELYWFSRAKIFGKAQEYHLFDCIECGCCAYVCPSHIPLVDYYRFAKSEIWAREHEKEAADHARERYEFRQYREEREKEEKAARLAAKTAAGREKATAALAVAEQPDGSNNTAEKDAKKALIAAALARAKQQQEQAAAINTAAALSAEQQAEIAAIEARRAEIREVAKPHLPPDN
ncbi:MAG: electron transport complex subunit RsxC [Rhodocyclaceae bacterium]|nr:electron transport complex subunit RsxC [Rhodocyclaceae bacterium]